MRRRSAIALLLGCAACAGGPSTPLTPVAPTPIDLAPRCLAIEAAPALRPAEVRDDEDGPGLRIWEGSDGSRGFTTVTPSAAMESTSWGYPPSSPATSFGLKLASALLRSGASTVDPEGFRTRVRALGASGSVHTQDGWLWLELRHPPGEHEAARALLSEWTASRPVAADEFDWTRRSVALARLAEDAAVDRTAKRAFERLAPRPKGAAGAASRAADDPSRGWDADELDAFLRERLRPSEAVRLQTRVALAPAGEDSGTVTTPEDGDTGIVEPNASTNADPTPAPLPAEPDAIYAVDRQGSPQVEILVGHATVGPSHPDAAPLEMLASLLGGDVGGRLFRDLRERQGLAYIINAFQEAEGRFVVTTRARPERVGPLLLGIEAHLSALARQPLLDCEVADLHRRMAGEEALRADDGSALRERMRGEVAWFGAPRSHDERVARHASIDRAHLESAAREHLAGPPIVVLVGDLDELRPLLAQSMPGRPLRVFDADFETAD